MNRRAFTLIEVLVVIGIIGVLLAILLPMAERVRHKGYIDKCASNLRSIGQALQIYADENHGAYPRTAYTPGAPIAFGTNPTSADAFHAADRPADNDITAAVFLLMRCQKIPAEMFICPYNDVTSYVKDTADIQSRSNFTNYKTNLSYSFADPYPDDPATRSGYKWTNKLGSEFAIASDLNPGILPKDDVLHITIHSGQSDMDEANSVNHEREGQNVLYGDGHVSWTMHPLVGVGQDNIFTNKNNRLDASPVDKDDSLLLPTDD